MRLVTGRKISVFIVVICLLAVAGCGGNNSAVSPQSEAFGTSALEVRVTDRDGQPVPGASVTTVSGLKTTTDADGRFTIQGVDTSEGADPVRFAVVKAGFIESLQSVRTDNVSGESSTISVSVTLHKMPDSADQGTEAVVVQADGTEVPVAPVVSQDPETGLQVVKTTVTLDGTERAVSFNTVAQAGEPANVSFSIGDPGGEGPNVAAVLGAAGEVSGSVVYGDPTDPEALDMFPGEFITESDTGFGNAGQGVLVTAGFARISLTDGDGNPITEFNGEATVVMRVPEESQNPETGAMVSPGDTIPIFYYNENTGEWVVEHEEDGSVKRAEIQQDGDGLFVEFTVSHLTWWNLDWKGATCEYGYPKVSFVNQAGQPVTGVTVYVESTGWIWLRKGNTYRDNFITFQRAPADIIWTVWGEKDGVTTEVAVIENCKDNLSGEDDFTLVLAGGGLGCATDADCDDTSPITADTCRIIDDTLSYCINVACNPLCSSDANCDDGNPITTDTCGSPGTCSSSCSHSLCPIACASDSDCADTDSRTVETCELPGACDSSCASYGFYCDVTLDKAEYEPGEIMQITLTAKNGGTEAADCGVSIAPGSAPSDSVWSSFAEQLYLQVPAGETASTVIRMVVPDEWSMAAPGQGTAYSASPIYEDGSEWSGGESAGFDVTIPCVPACQSAQDCDDSDELTVDSCVNAGACDAYCSNDLCAIECSSAAGCDDGDPLTSDGCANPATCDSYCSNTQCSPACSDDETCADDNLLTIDECVNPSTCEAECTHTPCTPVCSAYAECNDGDPLTIDTCDNPGTCDASCSNVQCDPLCSDDNGCDDGNPLTIDTCIDPGTCEASCSSTACPIACSANSHCSDADLTTTDTCENPGTCEASCTSVSCVTCNSNSECDDGNDLTTDTCVSAGTCNSYCSSASCIVCSSNADCNDGNVLTTDTCTNPGACDSSCSYQACGECYNASQCDDGDSMTADKCVNSGTCSAYCAYSGVWNDFGDGNVSNTDYRMVYSMFPKTVVGANGAPIVFWSEYSVVMGPFYSLISRWDGSGWGELGAGSSTEPGVIYTGSSVSMVVNSSGYPILGWVHELMSDGVIVQGWNGSEWVEFGNNADGTGVSDASGAWPSIAISPDDELYVTWNDIIGSDVDIYVKKWNGSSWEEVGAGSASGGGISNDDTDSRYSVIAACGDGNIVVAWENYANSLYSVYVKRWDGSAWVEMESGSASGSGISAATVHCRQPRLTCDESGNVYLAWHKYATSKTDYLYVKKWDGSSWSGLGGSDSGTGVLTCYNRSLSVAPAGSDMLFAACIGYKPDSSDYFYPYGDGIHIKRWSGDAWQDVGSDSSYKWGIAPKMHRIDAIDLASSPSGNPVVVFGDGNNGEIYIRGFSY